MILTIVVKKNNIKPNAFLRGGDLVENWALRYGHIRSTYMRIQRVRMCPKLKAQRNLKNQHVCAFAPLALGEGKLSFPMVLLENIVSQAPKRNLQI